MWKQPVKTNKQKKTPGIPISFRLFNGAANTHFSSYLTFRVKGAGKCGNNLNIEGALYSKYKCGLYFKNK